MRKASAPTPLLCGLKLILKDRFAFENGLGGTLVWPHPRFNVSSWIGVNGGILVEKCLDDMMRCGDGVFTNLLLSLAPSCVYLELPSCSVSSRVN